MGPIPGDKYSIDRINGSLGYNCGLCLECIENGWEKNCRWATRYQQAENRKTSRFLCYNGRTQCISAWARELKISSGTIRARLDIYGWTVEKALGTPIMGRTQKNGSK